MRAYPSRRTIRCFLTLTLMAAGWASAALGQLISNPIVFVRYQIPDDPQVPISGNLFRLDPDGTLSNLTGRNDAAVRDPEVSFDGTRVLFSMKIGAEGSWQIYEVGVDGLNLRQVSRDAAHNDLEPAYLPDGRIVFTTDRLRWADGYENVPTAQLAVMHRDGTGVDVIQRMPNGHQNPLVGADGMVYFTQWDFHDRRTSIEDEPVELDVNLFLLWKIFPDGSGLDHPLFGRHTVNGEAQGYVEARERPDAPGTFVATLGGSFETLNHFYPDYLQDFPGDHFTFLGGALVRMEPQADQDLDAPIYLAGAPLEEEDSDSEADSEEEEDSDSEADSEEEEDSDSEGDSEEEDSDSEGGYGEELWRSPLPLADGRIVAAFSPGQMETRDDAPVPWRLEVLNADGSDRQVLYEESGWWCFQPVEVRGRSLPPVLAGEMKPQYPYAIVNALDVTLRGDALQPVPSHGEATEVRFYREDVRSANEIGQGTFPGNADPDNALIGTAPVHPDGSLAVIVPVDTPLTWELLNRQGEVLVRERFGTELRAGELRQCAGCHSPHDGRTGADSNLALAAPTNLSGQDVDLDGDGVVDLLAELAGGSSGCLPGSDRLCLNDARFRVEVEWRDPAGNVGPGRVAPVSSQDSGLFWFFDAANWEMLVKVIDGCALNNHYWVYSAATTDVQFTLRVTDTRTGLVKEYFNRLGEAAPANTDSQAFATCP